MKRKPVAVPLGPPTRRPLTAVVHLTDEQEAALRRQYGDDIDDPRTLSDAVQGCVLFGLPEYLHYADHHIIERPVCGCPLCDPRYAEPGRSDT